MAVLNYLLTFSHDWRVCHHHIFHGTGLNFCFIVMTFSHVGLEWERVGLNYCFIVITFSHHEAHFFYRHHIFTRQDSIIVFIVVSFSHFEAQLLFLSPLHFYMRGLNNCFYRHYLFTWRGSIIVFVVIKCSHCGIQSLFNHHYLFALQI